MELPLLSSKWSSKRYTHASQKKLLQEILLRVDWQSYSIIFQEDVQNIEIWFEFFFQMSVSGERDSWKEPSKYLQTWEVTWNGKTRCKVVLKDFSQKQTTWKERIKKGQTGKEQKSKDWFIYSLVDLLVKPRQRESTCRSIPVPDSGLIRDRRAITIAVTTATRDFLSTL